MHTKPIRCYKGASETNIENVYDDVQKVRSLGHRIYMGIYYKIKCSLFIPQNDYYSAM
jgi:hypothetical protein